MINGAYWIGFGDIHERLDNLSRVPGLDGAAGIIISGDLTNRGHAAGAKRIIEAVKQYNPVVYAQIGNMDYADVGEYLAGEGINIHARGVALSPKLALIGVGASTPTPFGTPSEFPEEQIGQWLDEAYEAVKQYPHLLLVSHTPPYDTATDRVGSGQSVGSRTVRAFIERHQPEVCLTGHIHEARAMDTIGRTAVVNPGAFAAGGYAFVRFDGQALSVELKTL